MRSLSIISLACSLVAALSSSVSAQEPSRVEALETRLAELAAHSETHAAAIASLSERLATLSEEPGGSGTQDSETLEALDSLEQRVSVLETELGQAQLLQGRPARSVERSWLPTGLTNGGLSVGKVSVGLSLGSRLEASLPQSGSLGRVGFRLQRVRARLYAPLSERIVVFANADLTQRDLVLDAFADVSLNERLTIRAGQFKVPFLRNSMTFDENLAFFIRPTVVENNRYDRDIGVQLLGSWSGLRYSLGVSNGTGAERLNDNLDFLFFGRADWALRGDPNPLVVGDFSGENRLRIALGGGVTHDLVQLPARIAGIDVGNRDVDQDTEIDNVRVVSASLDLLFRYGGWELGLEAGGRYERWGAILSHSSNTIIANLVTPDENGQRLYATLNGHLLKFLVPRRVLAGVRLSYGQLSLLPTGGRALIGAVPPDDDIFNVDGLVQLYADTASGESAAQRRLGLLYRATVLPAPPDGTDQLNHQILLEGQISL